MLASKLKISVVLATFNGQAFLQKQLESLACQTFLPWELIISDDASSDGTDAIIHEFSRGAPFPVVRAKNPSSKGFRENFMGASKLATGDWIAFCDQDDVWRTDKLETCVKYMTINGVTQIAHQANLIDQFDRTTGFFGQGITVNSLRETLSYDVWGTFWGFSMLFDRRILEVANSERRFVDYIDSRYLIAHDRWAFFLAQTLGKTYEIAEPLANYRLHGNNLFGTTITSRAKSLSALKAENAVYVSATHAMLEIVKQLPSTIEYEFPAFNRTRALDVYGRALTQLQDRARIYSSSRFFVILRALSMLVRGGYRNAQNNVLRWRSFAKDISTFVNRT